MQFQSAFWYEITYTNGIKVQFQILDSDATGRQRFKLCDGQITTEVFLNNTYKDVKEIGKSSPCKEN